jgi:hypothetical protein
VDSDTLGGEVVDRDEDRSGPSVVQAADADAVVSGAVHLLARDHVAAALGLPFFIAGGTKLVYDGLIYAAFRNVRPPEEVALLEARQAQGAASQHAVRT